MRSSPLRVVSLAVALLVVNGFAHAAPARNIYPLKQVKAGQRAVAKSVFKGTKIETFHVEILGVVHKFEGTRSVILARILDGPVVARKSGVIEGMSGSPVYLGGKLVGAIAYGWSFSKEPIIGIQPIEQMLEAWGASPPARPAPTAPPRPLVVRGKHVAQVRLGSSSAPGKEPPNTLTLRPLGGLLQVSGLNHRASARLAKELEQYGVRVAESSGGGALDDLHPALVPGASLGVQLVRGDIDISGLGTVTYVEGGKLLAFGHPFFQFGSIDAPMTGGYVYDILPAVDFSFKLMAPTAAAGRIYRDHTSAIAGEMKTPAHTLPVTIEVRDRGGAWRKYSLEVIRQRELMPLLVGISTLTVVDEARARIARGSMKMSLDLEFTDRPPIHREDLGYNDNDAAEAAVPLVLSPLTVFTDNPFGPLPIKRVRLRLESEDVRRTATIERIVVPQSRFQAGDTVPLTVTLRPYGNPLVDVPMKVVLPVDLPKGPVRVVVSGGRDANDARSSLGAPKPSPVSLDQLLERYVSRNSSSDLVAQAALPRTGASLLGEELPDLPRGAYDALQAARPTDLRSAASVLKVVVPTEWELSGRETVTLQVESPLSAAVPPRPEPPATRPTPPAPSGDDEGDPSDADFMAAPPGFVPPPSLSAPPATKEPPKTKEKPEAEKAEEKPEKGKEPEKEAKPEKEQKPLTSPPALWVQRTRADYAKAKLFDVAIAQDGLVSLAPKQARLASLPADVIWSIATRDGTAYVGTGTGGVIYRVSASGEATRFFSTGEMNVHALVFDATGNLYAGTSPRGKLFRISPEGKGEMIFDRDSAYLWSLALAPDGTIYAGAGSPARIYAIKPGEKARVLAELPATNVLSLVLNEEGDLYAGTANAGIVYRVKPDGTASVVAQVPGASASALALDGDGNLYAASTPGGEIVRLPAAGLPGLYVRTEQADVYGLGMLPNGDVIAATGPSGTVLRLTGEDAWQTIYRPESGIATALAVSGDAIYLGSSTPTLLHTFTPSGPGTGRMESAVLDAERAARWGKISVTADTPEGTEVGLETRSGDSPDPDDHWSAWAAASGGAIMSPAARYLQYRLTLSAKDGNASPVVREVRLSRLPKNRPPAVTLRAPSAGGSIAKKYAVKWEGRDPDQNTLVYDLATSSDLGKTWKDLKTDLTDPKYDWDTAKTTDGSYLLRVTASDRRSQPWTPESSDDSVAVIVDNTAPTVLVFRSSLEVGEDKRARCRGVASDTLSPIVSVEYRMDDGEWRTLPYAAIDSLTTDFAVCTDSLSAGARKLELRAFDAAGNVGTEKVEVTVAGPKTEEKTEVKPQEKKGDEKPTAPSPPAAPPPEPQP